MPASFSFRLLANDGAARRGELTTPHGVVRTPAFMPIGTQGTVKGLRPQDVRASGTDIVLGNTYHLMLRPGAERIAALGGLHRFMNWPHPILTDSGGFQVFSLRHGQVADEIKGRRRMRVEDEQPLDAVRVDEEGADFRSYLDGSRHHFTPENNMELQRQLGADVLFCLDECTPFHVPEPYTVAATERNVRWARRCLQRFQELGMADRQALYGIVHGGVYPELRRFAAREIGGMGFPGFGIGDCLGETKQDWYEVVDMVCPLLPPDRPRHLLGVGEPDDLVEGALRGIDTFDCAMPTRIARHGHALHLGQPRHRLDLTHRQRLREDAPIEEGCPCSACLRFGRAYLHHLHRAGEMLAISLTVEHNLCFTARLLARVREAISAGCLRELRDEVAGSPIPS
jgi:queuine tRNA-ribosyltransferase